MWRDPIVEETQSRREELARRFAYDIKGVTVLMRISSSWRAFLKNLDIAHPKQNLNRELPFGAE